MAAVEARTGAVVKVEGGVGTDFVKQDRTEQS